MAFERVCYLHRHDIAVKVGFGAVRYEAGSWFAKGNDNPKTQIDLLFLRADGVITLCEVKFTDRKIGLEVIEDVERKLQVFPNPKGRAVEKVLVTASGCSDQLRDEGYFDAILGLELFVSSSPSRA